MRCSRASRRLSSPRYSRLAASQTPSARLCFNCSQNFERFRRIEAMRQRQHQQLAFGKFQQIVEPQMAFALLDPRRVVAALAAGEQLAQPAIGGAVARIDQDVRRAVDEDEARADQQFRLVRDLGIFEFLLGAHHAGQRVVVGDADGGNAELAGLMHIVLRMRAAAQEREIGGDADLGIADAAGPFMRTARARTSSDGTGSPSRLREFAFVEPVAIRSRTASPPRPRCGNNPASGHRRSASTIPWRCAPGPSTRTTACVTRRQVN